ncbi:MAG TPA: nickel pincer cofactor biosynthesis protein LarC [Dehalococcoidia bacterium]|nr:nickel pincer cofactor biosynthesis protein LarC [Dehalococcoidia bacterium]
MRVAYFDCPSGASGDMLLGALVDAGASLDAIVAALAGLPVGGYRLESRRVDRAGIAATKVDVLLEEREQPHRSLSTILGLIRGSHLPPSDVERGAAVFTALAEAEAKVHGVGVEQIEFHEVGAVDAIVDVLGVVLALRLLRVEACFVSPLPAGAGTAKTAHGEIPVPGPATLELLARARAPIAAPREGERFELVTPTGAALLTTLARFERPALRLERVGYGAGGRDTPGRPNVLRCWLGEAAGEATAAHSQREMRLLETNIDDMSPELFGWALERLFAAGAVDAWCTPIQMKKNRPAVMLQALCPPEAEAEVVRTLLRETSTLGVRVREVRRYEAARESMTVTTRLGEVRVKVKRLPGEPPRAAPEYDDCRELALRSGLPLAEVFRIVGEAAARVLDAQQG